MSPKIKKKEMSEPSVTFHKAGRFVKIKANDAYSADVIKDIRSRESVSYMRRQDFYGLPGKKELPEAECKKKIEIWRWLMDGMDSHPIIDILKTYGVTVQIHSNLLNYMRKEKRKQELENTPYPTPPITTDVPLFDRCCEGTVLKCIRNHGKTAANTPIFLKGNRYMVVETGGEGSDIVTLSTNPVVSGAQVVATGNAAKFQWTAFEASMEDHFQDSEDFVLGEDLVQRYPERVKASREALERLKLPLYEHVAEDASMMALKRGVMNAYPMRMAKTSCAIAVAELTKSQKVLAVAPGNARLFWTREFERMGFREGQDFVEVRTLDELESPAKYHLITYTWMCLSKESSAIAKARGKGEGYLKPSAKWEKKQKPGVSWKQIEEVEVRLFNMCPHCKGKLTRPARLGQGQLSLDTDGKTIWTDRRGYICRNAKCSYTTDTREAGKGPAWASKRLVSHKGGYIDYDLAKHAHCPDVKVKTRTCPECHIADVTWAPARYKRFKKKYTHVILDEAHATKDDNTSTSIAALSLRARRRQTLTGTPMSNSAMDIYYPLSWSMHAPNTGFPYEGRAGEKEFDKRFCDAVFLEKPIGTTTDANTGAVTQVTKTVRKRVPFLKTPPDFWKFVADKIRRRAYTDPLFLKTLEANGRTMPEKEVKKINCPMDSTQAALMLASIKDFRGTFEKLQKEAEKKGIQVNPTLVISQMTTMRISATCPELLNKKFGTTVYDGPEGGGKIPYIKGIVDDVMRKDGKVLILSDFRQMQETCERALTGYGVIRFNTAWEDETRREAFAKFQDDPDSRIFIAGTRAVREGVDLSAADTCICTDLLWSPALQTQAWSRIMAPTTRKRTCEVYLMLSANSLDEHIFNVFYSKLIAAEQALDRKILNRRAQEIDIRWFVERVLEEEKALCHYLRDAGEATMLIADLDLSQFEERSL